MDLLQIWHKWTIGRLLASKLSKSYFWVVGDFKCFEQLLLKPPSTSSMRGEREIYQIQNTESSINYLCQLLCKVVKEISQQITEQTVVYPLNTHTHTQLKHISSINIILSVVHSHSQTYTQVKVNHIFEPWEKTSVDVVQSSQKKRS